MIDQLKLSLHVRLAVLTIVTSKYQLRIFYEYNNRISVNSYITTVYLSFTHGIPPAAEHLFNLPNQWPSYCGDANTGK